MDVYSAAPWPSCDLSNFAAHSFELDGVTCNSIEGFFQSLKSDNPAVQIEMCKLVGIKAYRFGQTLRWKKKQTLYWKGKPMHRMSDAYKDLVSRAYDALGENPQFAKALLATGDDKITHVMGSNDPTKTILTEDEFVGHLMRVRNKLRNIPCKSISSALSLF